MVNGNLYTWKKIRTKMIQESDIEQILDWLIANANKAAKARAERIYVEEYKSSLRAQLMKEHVDLSVAAQEREACSSEKYQQHLLAIRDAVYADERMRWLMAAAEAKLEIFRTMQANARVQGKI